MNFTQLLEHHLLDHRFFLLFRLGNFPIYFTAHVLMMLIAAVLLIIFLGIAARQRSAVPTGARNGIEALVVYLRDEIVRPNLGHFADRYLSYFLSLFFFILLCNLLGLVPYGKTATGNISVTAGLAGMTFLMINFAGVREHGLVHHLQAFVPQGVPWWLAPLMFLVEIAGLVAKTVALCIRLFANMVAGHIVILAFLSLIFTFGTIFIAPASVGVAVAMNMLELFVAFLQAYVFTLLTAVFVGAAVNPH